MLRLVCHYLVQDYAKACLFMPRLVCYYLVQDYAKVSLPLFTIGLFQGFPATIRFKIMPRPFCQYLVQDYVKIGLPLFSVGFSCSFVYLFSAKSTFNVKIHSPLG